MSYESAHEDQQVGMVLRVVFWGIFARALTATVGKVFGIAT